MIIDSSRLRFVTTNVSREQESLTRTSNAPAASSGSGNFSTGQGATLRGTAVRQENVLLNASQSSYLYTRSQVSSADKAGVTQVFSREQTLQSLVSHAFSRQAGVSGLVSLRSSASIDPGFPAGRNPGTQAAFTLNQLYRYQAETHSSLTLKGSVKLADNRSVDFTLHTRFDSALSFESGSGQYLQSAMRTDPLILNLRGGAAELTDTAFRFDIDGDGSSESVSLATGGSGFIAFDRNGDGSINDGTELFGSRSGDGFADLAAFDEDGNGFIDSNDSIFGQLQFWSRDESGNDSLTRLSDLGVAAIGLENAATPHRIRGSSTQELGTVRSTGVFLFENGEVGSVQQLDLANRNLQQESAFSADFENDQIRPAITEDSVNPQRLEQDAFLQKLRAIHADTMARLDAIQNPQPEDNNKTLLELLILQLEDYTRDQQDKKKD